MRLDISTSTTGSIDIFTNLDSPWTETDSQLAWPIVSKSVRAASYFFSFSVPTDICVDLDLNSIPLSSYMFLNNAQRLNGLLVQFSASNSNNSPVKVFDRNSANPPYLRFVQCLFVCLVISFELI